MKFVISTVILLLAFSGVLCDDSNVNENSNTTDTTKIKRGVLGYPGYVGSHDFHYNLRPSYYSGYQTTPYASRFPTIFKHLHHPTTGYALSHGGASVTSYNINYPRYLFHTTKPHLHIPVQSPLPRPVIPTPSIVLAHKPIVPVAVPTFSSKPIIPVGIPAFSNRIPFVLSKPFHPPLAGINPFGVQSQFIPVPVQPTIHSFPANPQPVPLPGVTFAQPDPWRPILVNPQPTPTAATTPHIHRPVVNLLPPYGRTDSNHQAQLELQQDNDGGFGDQYAGRVSQLYLSPNPISEKNQPILQQAQLFEQGVSNNGYDQQGQGRGVASFTYDPPSNNGLYTGPSSYEVELGSYTRDY